MVAHWEGYVRATVREMAGTIVGTLGIESLDGPMVRAMLDRAVRDRASASWGTSHYGTPMTTVTKTKKTRIADIRFQEPWTYADAPSSREQKRQRLAFLEQVMTEKRAEGFECKIVGTGSYQSVAVYRVEQVEGRAQTRGVCQGCGGSVAVDTETHTSLHGYQRPGFGNVVGRCYGAQRPAANFDLTLAKALIVDLRASAARLRASADARDATELAVAQQVKAQAYAAAYDGIGHNVRDEYRQSLRAAWLAAGKVVGEMEASSRTDRFQARQAEDYAKHLKATALPALGTPLTEIVLAV